MEMHSTPGPGGGREGTCQGLTIEKGWVPDHLDEGQEETGIPRPFILQASCGDLTMMLSPQELRLVETIREVKSTDKGLAALG